MKFMTLDHKVVGVNHVNSDAPFRSKLQEKCYDEIVKLMPFAPIWKEFPIPGTRMTIDLFLPRHKIAFEIDGRQHSEYNAFFHGQRGKKSYSGQVKRDRKKEEWCQINQIKLIRITDPLQIQLVLSDR